MAFDIDTTKISWQWAFLRKAQDNFFAAKEAQRCERFDVAASRLYYAMYLAGKGYIVRKEGVPHNEPILHKDFPSRVALLTKGTRDQRLLRDACVLREVGDYEAVLVRRDEVEKLEGPARAFLNRICGELLGATN